MTTSPSAQEKAQQTASTAADEGKKVAGTAKEEAQNVASEAQFQARSLLDDATTQVSEQSRAQRDRLVGTLHSVSQDLDKMASQADGSGVAADLVRQVSQRTRSLGDHLDGREPNEILDDVRQFARRRPGTFLLGALAAGVVAGRLARGAKAAKDGSTATTTFPPVQPASGVDAGVRRRRAGGGAAGLARPAAGLAPRSGQREPDLQRAGRGHAGPGAGRRHLAGHRPARRRAGPAMSHVPDAEFDPTRPRDERSLGDIVSDVTQDLTTLIRQEMDLAKTEMKQEVAKVGKGAGMLGGAGLAGWFLLLFLSLTLMYGLDEVMSRWIAALIVAVLWAIVAAVLALTGKKAIKEANPQLPETQQTLKEDVQWARAQKS